MMTNKKSEGFTEDWVPSYVETLENLYGPLVEELSPTIEEMNEVLIKNFRDEPHDSDQGLSRWINIYLALLDILHGIINTRVVPSIESINQEWIECFIDRQQQVVDIMTISWINAYLDHKEMMQAEQESEAMLIEAVNQEWINCFYIPSNAEEIEFAEGWASSYLAKNDELHGAINWPSSFSIDEMNEQWIKLFMADSSIKKTLAKVA